MNRTHSAGDQMHLRAAAERATKPAGRGGLRCLDLVAGLALLLPLGACTAPTPNYASAQEAQTPVAPVAPDDILTGSRLTLRVPLTLPANGAPLLFQSNAVVTRPQLARNAPYCRFDSAGPGAPRAVKPTTFTVRQIEYDEREVGNTSSEGSVTRYMLASNPKEPGYILSCQWPAGAPSLAFTTTDEVQATVSTFFMLDAAR
jgi:hypothetical protein